MATYTYSLAADFPNGTIDELQLQSEADATSVSTYGDVIVIESPTDPSAAVAAHVPHELVEDASVSWATSVFQTLASALLEPWRGNTIRLTGEYKTGSDDAQVQLLENGAVVSGPWSILHTSGSWVAFTWDFAITSKDPAAFVVQGKSPILTSVQIRNAKLQVVKL